MEEDEDVILEGSELHAHLVNNGYEDVETRSPTKHEEDFSKQISSISEEAKRLEESRTSALSEGKRLLSAAVWSDNVNKLLEVELAQEILKSELLVTEDEDFINNFILSEDVLENYKTETEGGSRSCLGEVLVISGSLAAVAGAVFFLSERTRAAAAAAAILPSAMAAVSSARVGAKMQSNAEAEQFKELLKYMIQNMKTFKQLLRKSLNLIQGMEMMNQGYLMASGYSNAQASQEAVSQSEEGATEMDDENKLSKALCKRSSFIALRRAIYSCTLQMILVYRESVEFLMEVSPLAEHIDLKDHYLAFIELDTFGLESDPPDSRLSVRQLKDTIQLNLLQQSEYLRRFSLAFCDKVREDERLNKTGILKHVKETVTKIRRVTEKLAKVFEYHQALGLLPVPELEQRALTLRKQQSIDMVKKLLPLRNVYTSLFSTGLHLQNSLLKVRHLESFFDVLDKYKASQEAGAGASSSNQLPTEEKLLEWLRGFKDIQTELNACLTCLEDGVGQIDDLKRPPSSRSNGSDGISPDASSSIESVAGSCSHLSHRVISESDEPSNVDEVYEAFIDCDTKMKFEDDFTPEEGSEADQELRREHRNHSQKVLKELKSVLVVKEQEFQLREAKAIARQARVNSLDGVSSIEEDHSPQGPPDGAILLLPKSSSCQDAKQFAGNHGAAGNHWGAGGINLNSSPIKIQSGEENPTNPDAMKLPPNELPLLKPKFDTLTANATPQDASCDEKPVPLCLKISTHRDSVHSDMGLDQLSASSDMLHDSFYMRSSLEREINYQATSELKGNVAPTKTSQAITAPKQSVVPLGTFDKPPPAKSAPKTVVCDHANGTKEKAVKPLEAKTKADARDFTKHENGEAQPNENGHQELNGHFIDKDEGRSMKNGGHKCVPWSGYSFEKELTEISEKLEVNSVSSEKQQQGESLTNSSKLGVPEPLVKSSVLGLSQETDSDCDSFRSDTNTVKSQDTDPGHHSDSVSILHSSRTQDTLDSTPDSSDCDELEQKILNFKRNKLRSLPQMSNSVQPKSATSSNNGDSKTMENRSFSTPDLKRIAGCDITSPYVSLEKLPDQKKREQMPADDSSSSDSSSSSEEGPLTQPLTRPRRPGKGGGRARRPRYNPADNMARRKNLETKIQTSEDDNHNDGFLRLGVEPSVSRDNEDADSNISVTPTPSASNHTSVYLSKHRGEDLSYNTQPVGFTASLAAEAAARSRLLRQGLTNTFSSWRSNSANKTAAAATDAAKMQQSAHEQQFGSSDSN